MIILHYFLGFPSYRSGGLTKFAIDLMEAQVEHGDQVFGIWPGRIEKFNKKIRFIKHRDYKNIKNIEIVNPLPVSLDEGILDINSFMLPGDVNAYKYLLNNINPDIIHVHSLMGLHKEFLEVAHSLHIKSVFTTHDYFGLCPKVTFFKNGDVCNDSFSCKSCPQCNQRALSLPKICLLQSPLYRILKDSYIVKKLRNHHRNNFFNNSCGSCDQHKTSFEVNDYMNSYPKSSDYQRLRQFYVSLLDLISCIHFNSSLSESIYKRYMNICNGKVLPIANKNIQDHRKCLNHHDNSKLQLLYLSPAKDFKGFQLLCNCLDKLWEEGYRDFELVLYVDIQNKKPYMKIPYVGYSSNQLQDIFNHADILIAPSIWYETFGFVVQEALSFGVPVLISNHVGALDIISNGGIIFESNNKQELYEILRRMNKETINHLHTNILKQSSLMTWNQFLMDLYELYSSI